MDAGYAFFSLETALVLAVAALVALLAFLLHRFARIDAWFLKGLLIYLVADFYAFEQGLIAAGLAALVVALMATPARQALRTALTVAAVAFALLIATTARRHLVEPALPQALDAAPSKARPILHLVLDEHASLEGLRATPEGGRLADEIEHNYTSRGFRVYATSRATSGSTQNSLARAFSMDPRGTRDTPVEAGTDFEFKLLRNRYFEVLRRAGLEVLVLQNSFLEFCRPESNSCYTYSRAGHAATAIAHGMPLRDRLHLFSRFFHYEMSDPKSVRYVVLYQKLVGYRLHAPNREYWVRPASVLGVLDALEDTVRYSDVRGRAIFGHVLLPHFPYMLDSRCQYVPHEQWRSPAWRESRHGRYVRSRDVAYINQARCVHERVLRLIDNFRKRPGGADAVIVVHGDHGARPIDKARRPTEGAIAAAGPDASLDTFVAIRSPNHSPGVVAERALLDARLAQELQRALGSLSR